ncbi:hypothetical protein ACQY0O_008111 [Thecaphora frezii]
MLKQLGSHLNNIVQEGLPIPGALACKYIKATSFCINIGDQACSHLYKLYKFQHQQAEQHLGGQTNSTMGSGIIQDAEMLLSIAKD